ncbi:membrane bound O-acyl transferase family-domain-containing protein [Desarmillaria tabescens]|uniref:Membrane bound O-acyl transferase family-domain-containing protein n=1 Tax=Armillaria tabescens TaxID=1929756 RepID=A0AA39NCR3_ARMTA|nr:membrane bound O-acyl transferase family-domain-containing protein [Desarmillaria tabescens]KAK0463103.1 membrane bound O-acyl transferase family-domain-containing protein [Desarmillaria tabescens]
MADERHPFSYPLHSLLPVLLLVSITIRPAPYRRLLFLPIFSIAYYLVYHTTTGEIISNLSIGASIPPIVATALDYILLTDPQTELFQKGQTTPQASFPDLKSRLKWSLSLLTSQRGIGWTHEPPNLPPYTTPTSRWCFVVNRIVQSAAMFILWDAAATYTRYRPSFYIDGPEETTFLGKCAFVWGWAVPAVAALTMNHALFSAVMVALGIWDVQTWRPLYGSWLDAYTIRRFWSLTWHQLLRKNITTPGDRLVSRLSLPKNSILASYIRLYIAFFISGWVHHSSDYMVLGYHGGALKFFMSQALCITVESAVIALGRRLGFTGSPNFWRIVGYIWVQSWFAMCLPMYINPQNRAGVSEAGVNSGIIEGLWKWWITTWQ